MDKVELRYVIEKLGISSEVYNMMSDNDTFGILKYIADTYELAFEEVVSECPECGYELE